MASSMDSVGSAQLPDYVNDPRRPTVYRQRQADTLAERIRAQSKLEPISIEDYNRKVRRLRTIRGAGGHHGSQSEQATQETTQVVPRNRHLHSTESSFLNRVITFLGEEKASLESDPSNVASSVEQFIQEVMKVVVCEDPRFDGQLVACGSYYEGVKVKTPNEFDYLWELKPSCLKADDLKPIHIKPDTFKPRKHPEVYGRSYYKLEFKGRVPYAWRCAECRKLEVSECSHQTISSRQLQESFRDIVHQVASRLSPELKEAQVTSSGPAVTLFTQVKKDKAEELLTRYGRKKLSRHTDIDFYLIKIDLTLAIPVDRKDSYLSWPLEGFGDVELDPELASRGLDINKCHLVTAGDFWRVSFSSWETQLVQELTTGKNNKKTCFQALKYMRDLLALTGDHETSLLGTYPLKVTFLKENRGPKDDSDWSFTELSGKTCRILDHVERGGSDGKLTSYFIKNDPILLESDRSYLESRRIRQYLEKIGHQYRINGYVHLTVICVLLLCHITICLVGGLYLQQYIQRESIDECLFNNDPFIFEAGHFLFAVIPLTITCFVLSLVGFLWVVIQRWCIWTANVLYEMFKGPFYIYLMFVVFSTVQLGVAIRLGAGFSDFFPNCENTSIVVPRLAGVIMFFSGLICLFCFVHCSMFLACNIRNLKFYSWEIIFFDYMYREIFMSCRCTQKWRSHRSKQTPPPVLVTTAPEQPADVYEDVGPRPTHDIVKPLNTTAKRQPASLQVELETMAKPYEEATVVKSPASPTETPSARPVPLPKPRPQPAQSPQKAPIPKPRPDQSPPPPLPPRQQHDQSMQGFDNAIYSIT